MTSAPTLGRATSRRAAGPQTASRRLRDLWVWVVAIVGVASVHIYVALNSVRPVWQGDEAAFLLNAGRLSGQGPPVNYTKLLPYDTAWSLVMAPAWWVTSDSLGVYRVAIGISIACAVAVTYPLYRIARELGAGPRAAVVAAAAVAVLPSRVLDSNYVLVENFLTLVIVSLAAAALNAYRKPGPWSLATFALLGGILLMTHQRSICFVGVGIVWLLTWRAERRTWGWWGAGMSAVAAGLGYLVNSRLIAHLYSATHGREDALLGALSGLRLPLYAESMLGQIWYQVAATLGLGLVGALFLFMRFVEDLRSWRFTAWSFWFAGVMATLLLLSLWLTPGIATTARLDIIIYGRYLDPAAVVLTLIGLVTCMKAFSRRSAAVQSLLVLAVVWGFVIVLVPRSISQRTSLQPINVAGLMQYPWKAFSGGDSDPWVLIAVICTAAVVARIILARWRRFLPVPVIMLSLVAVVVTEQGVMDRFNAPWEKGCTYSAAVKATGATEAAVLLPEDQTYSLAVMCLRSADLVPVASIAQAAGYDFVISGNDWKAGMALGARRVAEDTLSNQAFYVMPGAQQRRLIGEGLVQPLDDSPLTPAAARYALARVGSATELSTTTTDPAEVTVRVTHTGGGEVWRVGGAQGSSGAVFVNEAWSCSRGGEFTRITDLSRSMIPGDAIDLPVVLDAARGVVGQCSVTVDLRQNGQPDLRFAGTPLVLSVTVR